MNDALSMAGKFAGAYEGLFGMFTVTADSDSLKATAESPDGDRQTSSVHYELCDDIESAFAKRKKFIDSKRRKLIPMGKLVPFETKSCSDDCYGGILNFHLMGKTGGFFFYTARRGNVLIFVQGYCTSQERNIPDGERDHLIDTACRCAER